MARQQLRVGIVGAGLGGLAAAIAMARGGAEVTLLEAAHELGEIGAGIQVCCKIGIIDVDADGQVFPNISRFLVRWGVDKIIGDNLVAHEECNTYAGPKATLIAHSLAKDLVKSAGFPWWVVRRDHLHFSLTESARQHGVKVIVDARVCGMDDSAEEVVLKTVHGDTYTFDLVIGADGIKSFIRQQLMPDVVPKAPSKVAAYRGVLSYEQIFSEVPEARAYLRNSMDVWAGPNGYILTYPISGGKELNIVTAFCKDDYVTKMEPVGVDEVRSYYSDYSPVIQKVLEMVKYTQRWPLLQMPPLKSWSNSHKNVVLLGDAAHCMQNHMAQGAATAVEDGAFLGRIASEIVRGVISIREGIQLYEERRMPKAWIKQQITFVSGLVNMTPERMSERNQASAPEVQAANENRINHRALSPTYRSWQFYCTPETVPGVFFYDAEGDADSAVCEYLCSHGEISDLEMLSLSLKDKWWGYIDDNGYETAHHANRPTTKHLTEEDYKRFGKGL